jgi:hypothetical protein
MAKKLLHRYTFDPANQTVIIEGNIHRRRLLLITNVTDNIPIYSFADQNAAASSITYDNDTQKTTVVLDYDTTGMSPSDTLQIFIEEDAVSFEPDDTYTDPVSKFRVSEAETLIDTDFEYGLQATKWETLELVNNIPGFYSRTGDTPISLSLIEGQVGSKNVIVTSPNHGLLVGTPIDVRGLNQTNLDGSYIVESVVGSDVFTFTARTIVNINILNGDYTYIVPGRFYAGSQINYTSIETDAAIPTSTVTVTTKYPNGFKQNTEFYLINTLGFQNISFNGELVDPVDTDITTNTLEPNSEGVLYTSSIRKTDVWNYTSVLNTKFFRAGSGGDLTTANRITIVGHGFTANQVVSLVVGPNSTVPTGLTNFARYFIRIVDANTIELATVSGGAAIAITANTGSGIIALYRGFAITAITSSSNVVTFNETTAAISTAVPLFAFATTTTLGTSSPAFNRTNNTNTYDAGSPITYYFQNTGTTTRTLSTGPSGGATLLNFSNNTVNANAIVVPYQVNTIGNSIYIPTHGFANNDLVIYNNGGGTSIAGLTSAATINIASISSNTTTITVTTSTAHGLLTNNGVIIQGVTPIIYNRPWVVASVPNTTTFTITSNLNPGSSTTQGTLQKAYFIDSVDANRFAIKETATATRVNLTSYAATGTNHSFVRRTVRVTGNKIFLPGHGLTDGTEVIYNANGNTPIPGLVDQTTYFVINADTNFFQLSESQGSTVFIDITGTSTGNHILSVAGEGVFDGSYVLKTIVSPTEFVLETDDYSVPKVTRSFNPEIAVDTTDNFITLPSHRLLNGTAIIYSNGGGSDIGGLTNNTEYFIIRVSRNRIKLASSEENAINGIVINLTSIGSGVEHQLESANLAGESDGPGTVDIVNGSNIVTGDNTSFTRIFKEGDPITINLSDSEVFETTIVSVLSDTSLQIISPASTTASDLIYLLKTSLYIKSEAYGVHRPYDGGVEINAGLRADTQIVRQTRRYFRYQSGKGLNIQFAINFNPPVDITELSSNGNVATVKTRRPHGLSEGQSVNIRDAKVSTGINYYNGDFIISEIVNDTTFSIILDDTPEVGSASGFPQLIVRNWGGAKLKAGAFDFQNGMFWEYDGDTLYAVRRNSTAQLAGTVNAEYLSNEITGNETRFVDQLSISDLIVIRGQTYKVVNIANNSTLYVQPAFKGRTANNSIVSKVVDVKVSQEDWSLDPCDGSGPTGYVLDVTRIQMAYLDYSWYGAGKIRFGFKDQNGRVKYVHEFKHNNKENKAFLRSGNLPARYEIENVGSPIYAPSLAHWGTTVQMDGKLDDDEAYLFTASSSLLTFAGTEATATGTGNYTYVNSNGTVITNPTTFSSIQISSVSTNFNTITFASAHNLTTGQIVQYNTTSGAIGGLTNNTFYYAIVVSSTSIALATTEDRARSNLRINLTSSGSGTQTIRFNFRFLVTKTSVPGYGSRIIHRFTTNASGFAEIGSVSFGTRIRSTEIDNRSLGNAFIYRVNAGAAAGTAVVDFFFENDAVDSLATGVSSNFIAGLTSAAIAHIVGTNQPIPSDIPLISVRLAPSVDSGLVGPVGARDIINRMQLTLDSVGLLTTHDMEVKLILNGQLSNTNWQNKGIPSLTQILPHQSFDKIIGGTTVFTFRAAGNPPDAAGKRTANSFAADISKLLSLGNCILGGDGVFPDGPDILTIVVSPLNTTGITVNSPISISARVSWSESQA